jgi:hypothetical protein
MPPLAHAVHRARGRLRLRVPGLRYDRDFFAGLCERLQALPGVAEVVANPDTAGVLIFLDPGSDLDPLALIGESGLLDLVDEAPILSPSLTGIRRATDRLDRVLAGATSGLGDLRTLTFALLVALALRQAVRGEVLAPAASLLWYAFDLMRFARPGSDDGPERR